MCLKCILNGGGTTTNDDCFLCKGFDGGPTYYLEGTTCDTTCTVIGKYAAEYYRECR